MTKSATDYNNELPIGVFDSGVGGLTVLKALTRRLPHENFLYLGDCARLPYGTKSPATITRYALQAASVLANRGVKLIVIACNTASATALEAVRETYPGIPVEGVVNPGAQAACKATRSGHVAVIATESTIRGRAYHEAISAIRPDARVLGKACPLFVSLAEEGWHTGEIAEAVAARYLDPVFNSSDAPDTLVLGCTHFPLLKQAIGNVINPETIIVDSAQTTTQAVYNLLTRLQMAAPKEEKGAIQFLTTDDPARFACTGQAFLGMEISDSTVELVDL